MSRELFMIFGIFHYFLENNLIWNNLLSIVGCFPLAGPAHAAAHECVWPRSIAAQHCSGPA